MSTHNTSKMFQSFLLFLNFYILYAVKHQNTSALIASQTKV